MGQIFISYRRHDSAYVAYDLHERLQQEFGDEAIFFDIEAIPYGVDFREYIDDAISKCDVLLVIMGNQWLDVQDAEGNLRLFDEHDFVRIEVESALKRTIPVIPVLLDDIKMPGADRLPESMESLAYRNAIEISAGHDRKQQVNRLVEGLYSFFGGLTVKAKDRGKVMPPTFSAPNPPPVLQKAKKPDLSRSPKENLITLVGSFEDDFLFVGNDIPADKLNNAISTYARDVAPDDVLVLFDNTVFRSAKDGMLLTADTVYWRYNGFGTAGQARYDEISRLDYKAGVFTRTIHINDESIVINTGNQELVAYLVGAIEKLREN